MCSFLTATCGRRDLRGAAFRCRSKAKRLVAPAVADAVRTRAASSDERHVRSWPPAYGDRGATSVGPTDGRPHRMPPSRVAASTIGVVAPTGKLHDLERSGRVPATTPQPVAPWCPGDRGGPRASSLRLEQSGQADVGAARGVASGRSEPSACTRARVRLSVDVEWTARASSTGARGQGDDHGTNRTRRVAADGRSSGR